MWAGKKLISSWCARSAARWKPNGAGYRMHLQYKNLTLMRPIGKNGFHTHYAEIAQLKNMARRLPIYLMKSRWQSKVDFLLNSEHNLFNNNMLTPNQNPSNTPWTLALPPAFFLFIWDTVWFCNKIIHYGPKDDNYQWFILR